MYVHDPSSLEELCLDTICDKIFWYVKQDQDIKNDSRTRQERTIMFKFADQDLFLPKEISEKLLGKFEKKSMLTDALMNLFNAKNTRLSTVKLTNCFVSQAGLQILKQHKILHLECVCFNVSIDDILDCLNEWSMANMTNLNLYKCIHWKTSMEKITDLKNLRSLNLNYTHLNQLSFNMICKDLKLLEELYISGTLVEDLSPLLFCKQLLCLSIGDLSQATHYYTTLSQLRQLRYLNVKVLKERLDHLTDPACQVRTLLEDVSTLPNLVGLDVSGWRDLIPAETLLRYIETHLKLECLGIKFNDCAYDPAFCVMELDPDHCVKLIIAGRELKYL